MTERDIETSLLHHIASISRAIGQQAGVGAMETAGSIVSFLTANPHYLDGFMTTGSVMDWPVGWHSSGCLTWHGMDGKIHWPGEGSAKQ